MAVDKIKNEEDLSKLSEKELKEIEKIPHPAEFRLYYDL